LSAAVAFWSAEALAKAEAQVGRRPFAVSPFPIAHLQEKAMSKKTRYNGKPTSKAQGDR